MNTYKLFVTLRVEQQKTALCFLSKIFKNYQVSFGF